MTYCAVEEFSGRWQVKHFPRTLPMINAVETHSEDKSLRKTKVLSLTLLFMEYNMKVKKLDVKSTLRQKSWEPEP